MLGFPRPSTPRMRRPRTTRSDRAPGRAARLLRTRVGTQADGWNGKVKTPDSRRVADGNGGITRLVRWHSGTRSRSGGRRSADMSRAHLPVHDVLEARWTRNRLGRLCYVRNEARPARHVFASYEAEAEGVETGGASSALRMHIQHREPGIIRERSRLGLAASCWMVTGKLRLLTPYSCGSANAMV